MAEVERWQEQDWYFAAAPATIVLPIKWVVWCARKPTTERSPMFEAYKQKIFFNLGNSKEEAITLLKREVLNGRS